MPNAEQLSQIPYRKDLAETLRSETNHAFRRGLLELVKNDPEYKRAKDAEKRRKLALREISRTVLTNTEDESFQASPVIGNPLVDLKPAERELTSQKQTILWANQVLDQYNNLPKKTKPEIKKAKYFVLQTAKRLVQNPQDIEVAGSVWKSRERASEDQQPTDSFYEEVKEEAVKAIERDWKKPTQEISSVHLAQFVKTYVNSVLTQDFAHDLLAGYFKGANSRRQRIDAYYNFAYSALDLVEDDRALNEAVRIGLYDTDILPKRPYLAEHSSFMELPYGEGERTFQKLLIAQRTIGVLTYITTENFKDTLQRKTEYEITDEELNSLKERRSDEIIRKIGRGEVSRLKDSMIEFATIVGGRPQSDSDVKLLKGSWPYNLLYDENEPQNKKLQETAMEKVTSESLKPYRADYLKNKGVDDVVFFSITSPRGFIIDVSMSRHLLVKKKTVVQYALSSALIEQEGGTFIGSPLPLLGSYTTELDGEVENSPILLSLRRPSGLERNQHPLQSLETIGFPNPKTEGEKDIGLANIDLAEEIRRTQLRFLNKRGVRIPVRNTSLGDFGYSYIDYQKDADDSSKTLVKIFVGDVPYSVKLDQYFNFDFEGKKFNAPFIQDALRYTILSYLRPILCDSTIKNAKGEEKDLETEIVSRMGHLMLLPSDRHRSVQAIVNCFRIEGKDLIALDAERREMRRKAGNRVPEDREYTYRRPVIEKEENLPPIIINLPGVLKFGNT